MSIRDHLAKDLSHLRSKGLRHWLISLSLVPTGMLIGGSLGQLELWVDLRYAIYRVIQDLSPHFAKHSKRTVMVLIGDDEYWRGELARRTPLKRDYLARLLFKLDQANPAAIGLDIDLRSQTPDNSLISHPDYADETEALLQAIRATSRNRCLVLARTLERRLREPAIYDSVNEADFKDGYVSLPHDIRRVPLSIDLARGGKLYSFSAALARCVDHASANEALSNTEDALPFGTFIRSSQFAQLSSKYVLRAPTAELRRLLSHQIIIVGGVWHKEMFGRGPVVDTRLTPVGNLGGSFIHGNYVEAILYNRTYAPMSEAVSISLEIIMSLVIALILSLDRPISATLSLVGALCLALILFSLFSWQNLGLFFDFFIPTILLIGHMTVDRVLGWRASAAKLRAMENK